LGKLFTKLYIIAIVVIVGTILAAYFRDYSFTPDALADYCSCSYSSLFIIDLLTPYDLFPYSLVYLGLFYTLIYWGLWLYLIVHTLRW